MAKDHKAVHRDIGQGKMPIGKARAEPLVVDPVARYVDHPSVAGGRARQHPRGIADPVSHGRGKLRFAAHRSGQGIDRPVDIRPLAQKHPVQQDLLLVPPAPFENRQGHIPRTTVQDRPAHLGCVQRRGQPHALQIILHLVHGRGHIQRQNQRQPTGPGPGGQRRQSQKTDRGEKPYQWPVFSMLAHGSAGSSASPSCNSSTEILSGLRTKAMRPSRGGRLMVTPLSCKCWHIS